MHFEKRIVFLTKFCFDFNWVDGMSTQLNLEIVKRNATIKVVNYFVITQFNAMGKL